MSFNMTELCQSFQQEQLLLQEQEQVTRDSSHYVSHSANKLGARLALTERYTHIHHPSIHQLKHFPEASAQAAADFVAAARQGTTDFRLTPPNFCLVKTVLKILEDIALISNHTFDTVASPTLAIKVKHVLDREFIRLSTSHLPPSATEFHHINTTHTDSGRARAAHSTNATHPDRDSNNGPQKRSNGDIITLHCIRNLCSRLTQPSLRSWQNQQKCKLVREQNMLAASLREGSKFRLPSPAALQTCVEDMSSIAKSHDLGDMTFEACKKGTVEDIQQKEECLRDLLQVRLLLRCQPFIVVCVGPARLGSFMQLAKFCKLHLELLPSQFHLEQVNK